MCLDTLATTRAYYAEWLGVEPKRLEEPGVAFLHNPRLNGSLAGYSDSMDLYGYVTEKTILFAYSDRVADQIAALRDAVRPGMTVEELRTRLEALYPSKSRHNLKYVYAGAEPTDPMPNTRALLAEDLALYLTFFQAVHPQCKDISWVEEYFLEIVEKGYCHAVILNGEIVSTTDAPNMPFLSDRVQEIGIQTAAAHRGKGYAVRACRSCIRAMLRKGICPLWSTGPENIASQKTAERLGFVRLLDNVSVRL